MSLSIIIPCLNEEKYIGKLIDEIVLVINGKFEYEIIVVDDFSKDQTANIVNKIIEKEKFVKLIRNAKNFGYGKAFKEGFKHAKKRYCTIIPGDGETNIEVILKTFLKFDNFDKIIFYNLNNDRGFLRNFLSTNYTKVMNFFFNLNLKYYQGSFIYKTEDLAKIKINSDGFFFLTEMVVKLIKLNPEYFETPLNLENKKNSQSGAIKVSNIFFLIKDFLRLYLLNK